MLVATGRAPIGSPAVSADNYGGRLLGDHEPLCPQLSPLALLLSSNLHPYCLSLNGKQQPFTLGAAHD